MQDLIYGLELRADDGRVFLHMFGQPVDVLEETHVAELVYLVVADRLVLQLIQDVFHIVGRGCQRGDATSREGDLGGRRDLVDQIGISRALAFRQDLDQVVLLRVVQMMYAVSIVPEDTEVRCGRFQPREPTYSLIAVGDAGRVRVFRHTPDAFDGFVFGNEFFHNVHIRAGLCHRHRDHFDPKVFRDGKVAIVAGHRAEEFHTVQFSPGRIAHDAVCDGTGNGVIHHIQGRIAVNDDRIRRVLHHITQQNACFVNAGQNAVVAAVGAVFAEQIHTGIQDIHHAHGEVELLLGWLPAAHIQVHVQSLLMSISHLQFDQLAGQFFF